MPVPQSSGRRCKNTSNMVPTSPTSSSARSSGEPIKRATPRMGLKKMRMSPMSNVLALELGQLLLKAKQSLTPMVIINIILMPPRLIDKRKPLSQLMNSQRPEVVLRLCVVPGSRGTVSYLERIPLNTGNTYLVIKYSVLYMRSFISQ